MRLKFLEIQGFKSFPERTRLEFNDGITAVVGPNGSGKSNIADAMRWVLGEQSTRILRGGKMEDVIFNGTQSRKAQGVCSVTLSIENSDRALPYDEDEVAITRRLYRSGESEYRICGAQVRLKDVYELFMDTGLGRDGYSIIGQGKVAEIVSAKSRERREIFEEAAGISKFRYRKTEAQRRLSLAEDNLLRLKDILLELEGRVEPLRVQSEKAGRFLELSGEKKALEVSLWVHTIRESGKRLAKLEDDILILQSDYDAAAKDVASCEEEFGRILEESQALSVAVEEARAATASLLAGASSAEAGAAVLKNDVEHNNRSLQETGERIRAHGESKEEVLAQIEAKRALLREKEGELSSKREKLASLEEKSGAFLEDQDELSGALDALRVRRSGVFEAIEAAKVDAAASATRLLESESRLSHLGTQDGAVKESLVQIEKEEETVTAFLAELSDRLKSGQNAYRGYCLKLEGREEKQRAIQKQIEELERLAAEKNQRARVLFDMDRNLEGFGPSVKHIMGRVRSGALDGVYGPVSSLISVEDRFSTAIETALGGALQNIVVEDEETAKRCIALLKNARAGRATFLPLTSVRGQGLDARGLEQKAGFVGAARDLIRFDPKFFGVVSSLLGRIAVADDLDSAVRIAREFGYRFRIVTLDGQVVNSGGSMTGGYTVRSAKILGRQGEIERLQKEAGEILMRKRPLAEGLAGAVREIGEIRSQLAAIEAEQKSIREDQIRSESEQKRLIKAREEVENAAGRAKRERTELLGRIERYRAESSGQGDLVLCLNAELCELQEKIARRVKEKESLSGNALSLSNEIAGQSSVIALLERDAENAAAELERLEGQLLSGDRQLLELREKMARLEEENRQAEIKIEALLKGAKEARESARGAEEDAARKMRQKNENEGRSTGLRAKEREAAARRDEIYRSLVKLTEGRATLESERDQIIAKLWDEYELSQSDAEACSEKLSDPGAANRRLMELKGKIRALGSVNVGAVEEYKEVSGRYRALLAQVSDVEKSKGELTKLIAGLTKEMCEIFTRQFALISQNFSRIFVELFGGGRGKLLLTDSENILESGIEISVQPPGKVIKNLSALSGGEQAFIAIAIFFAILSVNPAPFCLMDEIEAALDDVNVAKFASYLRNMTGKTQFIAITHRRGTMEEADVLYGVTMQDEGVSKLLELKVTEIEERLGIQ